MTNKTVSFAMVGCGFVADYYMAALNAYPELRMQGAFDVDPERLAQFTGHYQVPSYPTLEALLADPAVDIVLNLTNPRSHYRVSLQCLKAKKHVYSEKPLAMSLGEAQELVEVAAKEGVLISSAPCSVLGKAARTLSHAVRRKLCGEIRLVYAELDDGMIHKMAYKKWFSESGAPWPYRDEFEVGCTLEHAGYYVTWFVEMFGPVASVTAFSDCIFPGKVIGEPPLAPPDTADLSIGVLKFHGGTVARLSTSIVATHNHAVQVFGDDGVLYLKDCWDNDDSVYLKKFVRIRRKTFSWPIGLRVNLPHPVKVNKMNRGNTKMDFLLGVQAMAESIRTSKPMLMSPEFSLHVTEVALALQYAGTRGGTYVTKSRC